MTQNQWRSLTLFVAVLGAIVLLTAWNKVPSPDQPTTVESENTYRNTAYGLEVKHPDGWIFQEFDKKTRSVIFDSSVDNNQIPSGTGRTNTIIFGPKGTMQTGGGRIGIMIHAIATSSRQTMERIIAEHGSQFTDRSEVRETVQLGGCSGLRVVISTEEVADWKEKLVLLATPSFVLELGGRPGGELDRFVNSLRLNMCTTP